MSIDNTIIGTSGSEQIWGTTGNDLIDGGLGNDVLYGDAGDDILIYNDDGLGYDVLNGQVGKDTYQITFGTQIVPDPTMPNVTRIFDDDGGSFGDTITFTNANFSDLAFTKGIPADLM